jgi:hypothetical protein
VAAVVVPSWFAPLAVSLLLAYYSYRLARWLLRGGDRRFAEEAAAALGALIIAVAVAAMDATVLAAQLGAQPQLLSYSLTRRAGEEMQRAAEGVVESALAVGRGAAVAESGIWVVATALAPETLGGSLLAALAIEAGATIAKAAGSAATGAALAIWLLGQLYIAVADLAPLALSLLVPLGLALMPARPFRRAGATLFALGVLLGYALPFALNLLAYSASFNFPQIPAYNATSVGLLYVSVRQEVPVLEVSGSWSARALEAYVPPGAVVELRSGGNVTALPAGIYTRGLKGYIVPAGEYEAARVAVTNAFFPAKGRVTVEPVAYANVTCPPEAFIVEEVCWRCPRTGALLCQEVFRGLRLYMCNFTDVRYVNATVRVLPPSGDERERFFISEGPLGQIGFAAGRAHAYGVGWADERAWPPWYGDRPWPRVSEFALVLSPEEAVSARRYNCTITVNGEPVNTTCTEVHTYAYGTLPPTPGFRYLIRGESLVKARGRACAPVPPDQPPPNATCVLALEPQISIDVEEIPLSWSGGWLALYFNATAAAYNVSAYPELFLGPNAVQTVKLAVEKREWCLEPLPGGGCARSAYAALVTSIRILKAGPNVTIGPEPQYFELESPVRWPQPKAYRWSVRAVYYGNVTRWAVIASRLEHTLARPDERVKLCYANPLIAGYVRYAAPELRDRVRSIVDVYMLITAALIHFATAVAACDFLSGLLGGASLSFRFLPSRMRSVYWDYLVRTAFLQALGALAGRGLHVPHSALIPERFEPVLREIRSRLAKARESFPLRRLERRVRESGAAQALAKAVERLAARGGALREAVDEALRKAVGALEAKRRGRVPALLVDLTRNLLLDTGPRALYWASRILFYAWLTQSEHTVNALLRGAARALRAHALKRYGPDAHLHPVGFKLLRLADRLELVEVLLNNRALAERLIWRASLAAYERAYEWRVPQSVATRAVIVATQAKALVNVLLQQQREAAMYLLDRARPRELERAALDLAAKANACKSAREVLRELEEARASKIVELRATSDPERARRLREELSVIELELRVARAALEVARGAMRSAEERVTAMANAAEEAMRQLALPEVRPILEGLLREAAELAARAPKMGLEEYMRAAQHLEDRLNGIVEDARLPSWFREAAREALEWMRETWIKDWKAAFEVEAMFEWLREQALKGEILAPPKVEVPQPALQPAARAGLEELWGSVQRMGDELRSAVALGDERMHKLFDEYIAALERVEKLAAGTPLADLARLEREAWLAARDELLAPPEVLALRSEAEKLAGELRKALEARDYLAVTDKLPAYAELLARLSESPAPHVAEWAKAEQEKLNRVRDKLLKHYYELAEKLGGEPLAALEANRFAFELALNLAHASPDAAKPLLDRIPDKRMRDYAAGYIKAAEAYAKAREEVGEQAWARIHEEFSALASNEARAGFLAYAIERSLPFIKFHEFGSAARTIEEAFWGEAKRLAVKPEPEDWRKLLDEFVKTYDPEYVGRALASAALAGEVNALWQDPRVQGFIKKEGDVARFKEWWTVRPKREEEYERGVQARAERLREIEEGIAELRSWVPEPGEATSLRMHAELEMARWREEVAERLDQLDEVEAQIHSLGKLADEYLLPRHPVDSLLDWARRLREALVDLDAALK